MPPTEGGAVLPDYTLTCGAKVEGRFRVFYPFATLIADKDLIRIRMLWIFDCDTPRDEVRFIRRYAGLAQSGIVIQPLYPARPRSFIWTDKQEELLAALQRHGYPVENENGWR